MAVAPTRARGSNAKVVAAFEDTPGVVPANSAAWFNVPLVSHSLGEERPLIESDLLGMGREMQDPILSTGATGDCFHVETIGNVNQLSLKHSILKGAGRNGFFFKHDFDIALASGLSLTDISTEDCGYEGWRFTGAGGFSGLPVEACTFENNARLISRGSSALIDGIRRRKANVFVDCPYAIGLQIGTTNFLNNQGGSGGNPDNHVYVESAGAIAQSGSIANSRFLVTQSGIDVVWPVGLTYHANNINAGPVQLDEARGSIDMRKFTPSDNYSAPLTLTGTTSTPMGNVRFVRQGDLVTATFPVITGTSGTLATFNGVQGAYKPGSGANTDPSGLALSEFTGLPVGAADRYLGFAVVHADGILGGYNGSHDYWLDTPFNPGYRVHIEGTNTTSQLAVNRSDAHYVSLESASSTTKLRADGVAAGTYTTPLATTVTSFGIAGYDASYYTMMGYTFYVIVGKRAPTQDERWRIEWWVATNKTKRAIPSDNPYYNTTPIVDDGATASVTGSSASTLASIAAVSAAGLALAGAASLALAGIGSTATASAPIAAQAQAPLGAIVSASVGGVSATGSGTASLQSIVSAGTGVLPIRAASASSLSDVASSATGGLAVSGAASATLGPVDTVSAARADVRAAASTSLGSIVGSATAGGQSLATASSASVFGSISTAASGMIPVVGTGSIALGTIASNSGAASAVRGAGSASLGVIVSASAGSIPIGAIGAANLGNVRADGRGGARASAIASSTLGGIVGTASATVGQDTDGQLVGPGWTLSAPPRRFVASAIRRSFIVSSTGCKRMLNFPPKYAHEVRNAVVDFAPALSEGEGLTGQPTVAVMKGDLEVSAARIEGTAVHFTLSGGTASTKAVQWVEVHCPTNGDQVLEEVVSVTMLS